MMMIKIYSAGKITPIFVKMDLKKYTMLEIVPTIGYNKRKYLLYLNSKIEIKLDYIYLFQETEPFTLVISVIMAQSKDDFPLPTAPTMAVSFPTKS